MRSPIQWIYPCFNNNNVNLSYRIARRDTSKILVAAVISTVSPESARDHAQPYSFVHRRRQANICSRECAESCPGIAAPFQFSPREIFCSAGNGHPH